MAGFEKGKKYDVVDAEQGDCVGCCFNKDGYGVIIGEDSDGMIQKSNGIGNWMKEGIYREATREEIQNFFAKIRKTQKIINY